MIVERFSGFLFSHNCLMEKDKVKNLLLKSGVSNESNIPGHLKYEQFSAEEITNVLKMAVKKKKSVLYVTKGTIWYCYTKKIPLRVRGGMLTCKWPTTKGKIVHKSIDAIRNVFLLDTPRINNKETYESRRKEVRPFENIKEQSQKEIIERLKSYIANGQEFQYIRKRGSRNVYENHFTKVKHMPYLEKGNLCYYANNKKWEPQRKITVPLKQVGFVKAVA